jgi:hypothetical protein
MILYALWLAGLFRKHKAHQKLVLMNMVHLNPDEPQTVSDTWSIFLNIS